MTDPKEDEIVKAMAIAMCVADGENPYNVILTPDGETYITWRYHEPASRRQYRAWLAMQSVILDQPARAQEKTDAS